MNIANWVLRLLPPSKIILGDSEDIFKNVLGEHTYSVGNIKFVPKALYFYSWES